MRQMSAVPAGFRSVKRSDHRHASAAAPDGVPPRWDSLANAGEVFAPAARLQSRSTARSRDVNPLAGKWRPFEPARRSKRFVNLLGPAHRGLDDRGRREFCFGANARRRDRTDGGTSMDFARAGSHQNGGAVSDRRAEFQPHARSAAKSACFWRTSPRLTINHGLLQQTSIGGLPVKIDALTAFCWGRASPPGLAPSSHCAGAVVTTKFSGDCDAP